jgi:hypothetical protein
MAYALLLGIGVAAVWLLVTVSLPLRYPLANDTAGYVEEAVNFLSGKGLARTGDWSDVSGELAVSPLFPPGFPLMVATLSAIGLAPREAALAAAWSAWILFFPAAFFAVRPLFMRLWPAASVAVAAGVSPALYDWGFQALSDGTALLLSTLSIGALIRAAGSQSKRWHWAVVSGVTAGAAYTVRNAAIILPAVAFGTFAASIVLRALPARVAAGRLLIWGAAAAVAVSPLLARNVFVFGAVQPYFSSMGAVDFGWLRAFRLVLWSELLDLTGLRAVAQLAWNAPWLLAAAVPVAAVLATLSARWWKTAPPHERVAAAGLTLFAVLGFALITSGRARFDWVETELTRHVMQYSWAVLALIGAVALGGGTSRPGVAASTAFAAVLASLMAGHGWFIVRDLQREATIAAAFSIAPSFADAAASLERPDWILTNQIRLAIGRDEALKRFVRSLPPKAHVVSNFAETLSLEAARPVRPFPATGLQLAQLDHIARQLPPERRPLVAILLPTSRTLHGPAAIDWQASVRSQAGSGFRAEQKTRNVLVLVYD